MSYTNGLDKPTDYFNTVLYSGNGSSNSITGVGFSPNMVWIKERSSTSSHTISDTIRGTNIRFNPDLTSAEETLSNLMTSFDADGFSHNNDAGVNESGQTYVSWNWLAGVDAGSSNTDGSITSTVSANTTAGFSIVSFTGDGSTSATIGHGLGQTPELIIQKRRDSSTQGDWQVAVKDVGVAYLNFANAFGTSYGSNGRLNYTGMTSTTYNFGTTSNVDAVNTSSATYITYCFASKKGFSKIGSYTGNSNNDGTFIYTGFKPSFLIAKCSSASGSWFMADNKRDGFNVITKALLAESSASEANETYHAVDFLSNGFKWRGSDDRVNVSGKTYIYMAFAENPFVTSTGIPTTAR